MYKSRMPPKQAKNEVKKTPFINQKPAPEMGAGFVFWIVCDIGWRVNRKSG